MLQLTLAATIATALVASASSIAHPSEQLVLGHNTKDDFKCDLPAVLDPSADGLPSAKQLFSGEAALKRQARRHAAIVQVPSVSYDDNGDVGTDPRWKIFYEMHAKLAALYPVL
jgi:Gly-Xaa carboxypeptidase